ncbi:MAG: MBL fold metallo-hydrolase [Promethearchaeota archaeon]|nr:MAG: MBL fold metallo-hydrolase [Candidatus Lokiarchaeota archaeon]
MFKFDLKSEINEIDNNVIRFKIDFPPFEGLTFVCMYLLKIDGSNVLIDAGLHFKDWKRKFFSGLKKFKLTVKDIDYCIVTHDHIDHIGLIKTLNRKNPDMRILMHKITHDLIKWGTDVKNNSEVEMVARELAERMIKFGISKEKGERIVQFFSNWHKLIQYCKPDRILDDNDEVSFISNKLKIIWTPGHAPGHICIFDTNNRYLFSGDHILSRITPHIGSFMLNPSVKNEYDLSNILEYYLKSLDKIDALNPKIIFPAHQEVIYSPHERISEIKKHHDNRLFEISSIIKNNPLTPNRISQLHFGDNLSEINTFLAISEVISHLIYLERQNKIKRVEKDGKILFFS